MPYSNQASVGIQQSVGQTMSFQVDYVVTDSVGEQQNWNHNLTYNPASGINYPYAQIRTGQGTTCSTGATPTGQHVAGLLGG